jgi:hypothetical protein
VCLSDLMIVILKCSSDKKPVIGSPPDLASVETVCFVSCRAGYRLVGTRRRTCLPVAMWTGMQGYCKRKAFAFNIFSIKNVKNNIYNFNTRAQLRGRLHVYKSVYESL